LEFLLLCLDLGLNLAAFAREVADDAGIAVLLVNLFGCQHVEVDVR